MKERYLFQVEKDISKNCMIVMNYKSKIEIILKNKKIMSLS